MVGGEHHPEILRTHPGVVFRQIGLQVGHAGLALGDVVHQVVELPGIGSIEGLARIGQLRLLGLGQQQHLGIVLLHLREDTLPELGRDLAGGVAAEAVHALVQPETHAIGLGGPDRLVLVIEAAGVGPVILPDGIAQGIALVEIGRFLGHPDMVRGGLVGHPVEDHLEAQLVGLGEEVLEVSHGAELGVDLLVVGNGIVGAQGALALNRSDLIHRHQPEDVDTEFFQARQLGGHAVERGFRRELADVDFIDDRIVDPFGMQTAGRRIFGGLFVAAGDQGQEGCRDEEDFLHIQFI